MNKTKLLSIIATVLFISNVALAAFMFFGKHRPPAHEGPRDIIIERLHFDKKQVEAYDKLINQHQNAMREKKDEMMELKNKLYSRLLDDSDDAVKDSLEREIGKLQITIENINYNHFNEIKLLCKADQQQNYSKLIHEIAFLFAPHRSGKPGKP